MKRLVLGNCKHGKGIFLGPSGRIDDYVNHSCCPNTGVLFDSGVIKLVAVTSISAGSEITFDYSTTMDNSRWEMDCACLSRYCRHKIKNFVELESEIQAQYIRLGLVPDYILQKYFGNNSVMPMHTKNGCRAILKIIGKTVKTTIFL